MSTRRAIQACRFLRPPSFVKRATLREKPRVITGPFENPVRRFVRLREKARAFCELPPPRKIPVAKPVKRTPLKPVEGVPTVDPEVLQRRLDFLLSDKAIEQQLMAPLRAGRNPYQVEADVWERQMLEIRKIYRAQYLQKLAEVTEQEKKKEQHRFEIDRETRKERKMQYLAKIGEDKKRRAILQDRLRVERKVNEIVHMARVSKLKKRQLYWLSQIEKQAGGEENIVTGENLEKLMPLPENQMSEAAKPSGGEMSKNGEVPLFDRNVSVPFLMRQLDGADAFPKQKNRRIHQVDNVYREVLESSYNLLPEDGETQEPEPKDDNELTPRQRAHAYYQGFTEEEKLALLEQKIDMLRARQKYSSASGVTDVLTQQLLDQLDAAKIVAGEKATQARMQAAAEGKTEQTIADLD